MNKSEQGLQSGGELHRHRNFMLDEVDKAGLRALMRELGIKQDDIARRIGISQTWISSFVGGNRPVRDFRAITALVGEVRTALDEDNSRGKIPQGERDESRRLLNHILESFGEKRRSIYALPYGVIPPDAINYVQSPITEDRITGLLNNHDRRNYRFSLILAGSPMSGKNTLMRFIENEAQTDRADLDIARTDCRWVSQWGEVLTLMSQDMAYAWKLPIPPQEELLDSNRFNRWLIGSMEQTAAARRRLLLVYGTQNLGDEVKTNLIKEASFLQERYCTQEKGAAVCLEITPDSMVTDQALADFHGYRINVPWFDRNQVNSLAVALGGSDFEQYGEVLYDQYAGQPFLTHQAVDLLGKEKSLTPVEVYQQVVAGKDSFGLYIDRIRRILKDPDAETLFRLVCEAGELDCSGLGVSEKLTVYLVNAGLIRQQTGNDTITYAPRSRFYTDLANIL